MGQEPTLPPDGSPPLEQPSLRTPRQSHALATWLRSYRGAARLVQVGIGTGAVVLFVLFSFIGVAFVRGGSTGTAILPTATTGQQVTWQVQATATSTPAAFLPQHPLAWHPVTLPQAATFPTVAFAGDGQTAYACAFPVAANGQLRVWTTTDRAAHWVPARSLPSQPSAGNRCELVVDQSDPSVAALCWVPNGGGAGDSCTVWLITTDGGSTWRYDPAAINNFAAIDQLDSRSGVIYALRETASSSNTVIYHLWRSYDRMRSWQQVDHGLLPAVAGFWLQPGGRGIFAVVSGGANLAATQLFTSPDDGASWKPLTAPIALPAYQPARFASGPMAGAIAVLPHSGAPFEICVANYTADAPTPNALSCSTDGGVSWRSLPPLFRAGSMLVIGIAGDRAILAIGADVQNASGAISDYTLHRFAEGASQWQPLGSIPQFAVTYVPAPGAGTLWAYIAPGMSLDPQQRLFTAAYS